MSQAMNTGNASVVFTVALTLGVGALVSACDTTDRVVDAILPPPNVAAARTTAIGQINILSDFQGTHDRVIQNARSCLPRFGYSVKAFQLSQNTPGQMSVFVQPQTGAEPLPKDLRFRAFIEPLQNGGIIRYEVTENASPEIGTAITSRLENWAQGGSAC